MTPPLEQGELDAMIAGEPFTPGATMQEILSEQAEIAKKEPASSVPVLAQNPYNRAKSDGKPTAAREATKSPASESKGVVTPPPGTFNTADMSDQDVIALSGIHVENLPSQLEPDSGALAALGEYVLNEGISSRVTNDLVNWWTDVVVETIGREDVDLDALAVRFHNEWKGKLDERQRFALADWMRRLLSENGGEA